MTKGELYDTLGVPDSSLVAGPKEVHQYPDGKRVNIVNGRVVGLAGFPEDGIAAPRSSSDKELPKASTAYTRAQEPKKTHRPFVDFDAVKEGRSESFTLKGAESDAAIASTWEEFLNSDKAPTFFILGGGVIACAVIWMIVAAINHRRAARIAANPIGKADSELPPFLKSTPIEKYSLLDPRGDTSELREERLAMRDDPNSMGLSIRGPIYQDYDPYGPRTQLVGNINAPQSNPAYAAAKSQSRKPARRRNTASDIKTEAERESQKESSLKLKSQ